MTEVVRPEMYFGRTAVDQHGRKIGTVGQIYVNDQTGEPDWITVNTGLLGLHESFAPLAGSRLDGDELVLPFDKEVVKDAPDIADKDRLEFDEQGHLLTHYGRHVSGLHQARSAGRAPKAVNRDDVSGEQTDDAMTRSEEQLRVGRERVESGRAQLRKYVVTEQQAIRAPVTREEVRVEREPITDANRDAALTGPTISEQQHEVVLHEERPVVKTETVPMERVRLETDAVTEDRTVTGKVRKEKITLDDETSGRSRRGR